METFYLFFLVFFFFMIIKSELVLFFYSDGFLGWLGQGGLLCNFHIAIFRDKRGQTWGSRIPHNDGIFQFCDFFGEYFGKNVSIHFLYTSIHVLKIEFVGGISETRLLARASPFLPSERSFQSGPERATEVPRSSPLFPPVLDSGLISSATRKQPPLCWSTGFWFDRQCYS